MPVLNVGLSSTTGEDTICAPWADVSDACAGGCSDYDFDAALLEDGIQAASEVLYNLTGRRWPGVCTTTVRPGSSCECHYERWDDEGFGCGCGPSEVRLSGYPVVDIVNVTIDGVTVDPARYRVDDRALLVYEPELDGSSERGRWPSYQHLNRAAGEEGTWTVSYEHGQDPPIGGVRAAASLGCQLALACLPPDDPGFKQCRLPKRVTSITRQGVTLAVIDPLTLFRDGLTGLSEVDLWIASITLGDQRRRGHAFVPGRDARARVTTST